MSKDFKRQDSFRHIRIGSRRRRIKWKRPDGRDSKMRLKRRSYPASPMVGNKSPKKISGKVNGMKTMLVYNISDLEKVHKSFIPIIAKIGAKKRMELIKYAEEKGIKILNVRRSK